MNNYPIPVMAYALIGITTLVFAYATFLDKGSGNQTMPSATNLLPTSASIQSLNPFSSVQNNNTTTNTAVAALPIASIKPAVGGRTKRNKKSSHFTKRKNHK
jgi:hypothetical protein